MRGKRARASWFQIAVASAPIKGLYAITDPQLIGGERLLPACEQALSGGARILQYRDKNAPRDELIKNGRALKSLCEQYDALLLINDDPILAGDIGADGVHIGQTDGGIANARKHLGDRAIIGVTCHSDVQLAQHAINHGADYVAFGRFFASHTKPHAPAADIKVLSEPLFHNNRLVAKVAIGGVTPDNAPQLVRAGASALAVIHALFASDDIEATARRFARLFPED